MQAQLTAVFQKVPGGYIAFVEELPGANTQGATLDETRTNLEEAVTLVLEVNRACRRRFTRYGRYSRTIFISCVKRFDLLRYLEAQECRFVWEGGNHTVYLNPVERKISAIPRHREIDGYLMNKICKDLKILSPKA